MDKHTARGLAIGLFFTAMILIVFKPVFSLDQETVASYLEDNNLVVVSKEELVTMEQSDLSDKSDQSDQSTPIAKEKENDKKVEKQASKKNQEKMESKPEDKVFSITEGMVSSDVAFQLKKNGLIKNQGEFVKTLESKNGAKYIQIGEYKLNSSMTYGEIISVITRNRV